MDTKPHRNDTNADAPLSNSARYDAQERLQKVLSTIPLWRRIHAHIVLWAEAIWPIISPALAFMLIWIGLAALDVFSAYPGSGLLSLLIVLGLGGYLARNQLRQAIWPDQYAVLRRLETDNRLKHRPFSSLTDDLANTDDAVTRALWARHLARLKQTLPTRLSVGGPQTHAARRDPFALRYLPVLLAILGIAIAGNDTVRRLGNALSLSSVEFTMTTRQVLFDAWIAPPAYTNMAPIFLTRSDLANNSLDTIAKADALIGVPSGSIIFARISGERLDPDAPPTMRLGNTEIDFELADPGQFHLRYELTSSEPPPVVDADTAESMSPPAVNDDSTTISFRARGRQLGNWDILIIKDEPPSIVLSDTPSVTENQLIAIPYAAIDDYGLQEMIATLTLVPAIEGQDQPLVMEHILGAAPEGQSLGSRLTTTAREDLIAHPWAGLDVDIQIAAIDAIGQQDDSDVERLTLPMRPFRHPVARSMIEQRQLLTLKPVSAPPLVSEVLRKIAENPDSFNNDSVIIIGLSALATRLELNNKPTDIKAVQQLLWELALRLEDGQIGLAQRALERAADELADALEPGSDVDAAELQELIEAYEQALEQFMQAMHEELMEQLARGELPELPPGAENQIIDPEQMREMIEQMRDLAETGARDAAREMLSQLEQMLENLQNREVAEPTPEQQELRELAERIQGLTQEQQELMDDTFKGRPVSPLEDLRDRLPEGMLPPSILDNLPLPPQLSQPPGSAQNADPQDTAEQQRADRANQNLNRSLQQEALRLELGEIMLDLSDVTEELPENLGMAERAMNGATSALRENRTARALQEMGEAIEELQALQNELEEQANEGMAGGPGGQPGMRFGVVPSQRRALGTNQGYDPLGRDTSETGQGTGSDVEIPSESDVQRARGILDELRRRSGEFERPEEELDYIDRLLDRF